MASAASLRVSCDAPEVTEVAMVSAGLKARAVAKVRVCEEEEEDIVLEGMQ